MGIQCKPRAGLLDVMESQAGGKVPEKTTQAKLPPLLPLNLFVLTLLIVKGKGIRKATMWWKGGKAPYPRRSRLRKKPSRPG